MMIVKRRYMTILELLLVFAIVSGIAGFIGINVSKAVNEQRFRSEVELVLNELRLAQDLMLTFNGNVHMKIVVSKDKSGKGDGFNYGLAFEHPMPQQWSQELQRDHPKLVMLHYIDLYEGNSLDENKDGLDLKFLSGGASMSHGVLRLATSTKTDVPDAQERYICLSGYPGPIISVGTYDEAIKCIRRDESLNEQMTARTRDEIRISEG